VQRAKPKGRDGMAEMSTVPGCWATCTFPSLAGRHSAGEPGPCVEECRLGERASFGCTGLAARVLPGGLLQRKPARSAADSAGAETLELIELSTAGNEFRTLHTFTTLASPAPSR